MGRYRSTFWVNLIDLLVRNSLAIAVIFGLCVIAYLRLKGA